MAKRPILSWERLSKFRFPEQLLLLLLAALTLSSCSATKQSMTVERVAQGYELENIRLLSFNSFFNTWALNRSMQKIDLNSRKLFEDGTFTYFGRPSLGLFNLKWSFFKVHSDSLLDLFPNYESFYADDLSRFMWSEVVPKDEIDLWNHYRSIQDFQLRAKCPFNSNRPDERYALSGHKVVLTLNWDVRCRELESLKNKSHQASFDLHTGETIGL